MILKPKRSGQPLHDVSNGTINNLSPVGRRRSFPPNICRRPTAPPKIRKFPKS